MKRKNVLVFSIVFVLLVMMAGTSGGAASNSIEPFFVKAKLADTPVSDGSSDTAESFNQENRPVKEFLDAFDELTHHGEWLGFHPGNAPYADDICLCVEKDGMDVPVDVCMPSCDLIDYLDCCPTRQQHYQGIARAPNNGEAPIFYVARAGKPESSLDPTEGALWVVEMGSRDDNGERLRSNRLQTDRETQHTVPDSADKVVNYQRSRRRRRGHHAPAG